MILQKKLESENFQRIICEKKLERQKILKEKFSRGKIKILYTFLWKRIIKMLTIV